MKFRNTQPLEEATPVVPETAATIEPDERRVTGTGGDRSAPPTEAPDTDDAQDTPATETYPQAPAGSAGHP
ncbi:MAG: hypothetical protein QOH12_2353 [Solirubrobacteraceae bacterium]|nr:hypothetical protein [Solirubrobacteraceae bacterium]